MPKSAPKPCGKPGCGVLVHDGTSRCAKHPQANRFADKARGNRHERGYGTAWTKLRKIILDRDMGLCQPCQATGRVTLAREVDHTIPKAEGGTDDQDNLQAICRACHLTKSKAEARRGVDRGWGRSDVGGEGEGGPKVEGPKA
jgi:5-methylcytosine-specific restriction protein A